LEVVNRYRRGLPAPITGDVLVRAGISDSLTPRTLQALQLLDLIDDKGAPTATLEGLRRAPEPELQKRMADWLNSAYADVLSFIDPAKAEEGAIRDAFRNYNPVGQQPRMVTLFTGLYAAAGVRATEKVATPRAPRPPRVLAPRTKAAIAAAKVNNANARKANIPEQNSVALPPAIQGLLASLPKPGTGWTKASRDSFHGAFGTILDFCYPIMTPQELDAATMQAEDDGE
jgi:hypothetical protein